MLLYHLCLGFLPFGVENGDLLGAITDSVSTFELNELDVPVIFYQSKERNLHVSTKSD